MKPLSYWVRNPEIREFAIPLIERNQSRHAVVEAIVQTFGQELAPTSDEQITKLRMQLAKGRWNTGGMKRMSGTEAASSANSRMREGSSEGKQNMRAGTPATTEDIREMLEGMSAREARKRGRIIMDLVRGHRTFWDSHPSITDFAIRMIQDENETVRFAIQQRFGAAFKPNDQQINMLREGIRSGRFELREARGLNIPTQRVMRMFSEEQVAGTECLLPGVTLLSRKQCLKRQIRWRVKSDSRLWNGNTCASQSKRMLRPELAICGKCQNWLTDAEISWLRKQIKKGSLPTPEAEDEA